MTEDEKSALRASNAALAAKLKSDLAEIPISKQELRSGKTLIAFHRRKRISIRSLIAKEKP